LAGLVPAIHTLLPAVSQERRGCRDDLIAETRLTYSGPLEVGEDPMSFEIGDTVTVHHFKQ
jgi:hypothetical protein